MRSSIEVEIPNGFMVTGHRILEQSCKSTTVEVFHEEVRKYREPTLPADAGKLVQVAAGPSLSATDWTRATLLGYDHDNTLKWRVYVSGKIDCWPRCRIEVGVNDDC